MKKYHLATAALLMTISPVAAEARCGPNTPVIAAKAVPVIQYKNTTIDGVPLISQAYLQRGCKV